MSKEVRHFVIAEYEANKAYLDQVGPHFDTFTYPILVLVDEEGTYTVVQYPALDQIFLSLVSILAAKNPVKKAIKPRGTKK